jgi:chemotaxis protein CheX
VKAEFICAFDRAAVDVFATMFKCELTRGPLSLSADYQPAHEVSGIIGLSGRASGTVVVSVDRHVALSATEEMLGQRPDSINSDVIDAIGEVTNMIAGRAKAELSQLAMNLALPTVITGKNHTIRFGSNAQTICIPYSCAWGELSIEVGLVEAPERAEGKATSERETVALAGAR